MRNRVLILTAALLLASHAGMAQTTQPAPTTPQPVATTPSPTPSLPWVGTIDLGGAFGDTDGDTARYERYRDTRNGVYSDINFSREAATYFAAVRANHIGYRDQRIEAEFDTAKFNFGFIFDSIPTNYYYDALTAWTRGGTTLSLNDDFQRAVENRQAVGVPCAPGSGPTTCNNTTSAAALANRSIYNNDLETFEMRTKRQSLGFEGTFFATRNLDVSMKFLSTSKEGEQPWGASFSFNNANEVPLPIDNRTNDLGIGAEWAGARGMVRVGWDGSWFDNNYQTMIWDNPIRLTDYRSSNPSIPWDASGYLNGNGPAQGRMALFPSNSMNVLSATGLFKLARATAVNGTLQFTNQEQDENLIPWTINEVINQTAPGLGFPHLASLPRNTAEASASGLNALINFTSRPFAYLGFQARYRYNDRDVETPEFDASEYVRFDAVPEEIEHGFSEQFDVTRQNFDATATLSLLGYGSFRVGYGREDYERQGRGFSDSAENVIRLSYDAMGLSFLAIRLGYDYGQRRGDGFYLAGQDYETQPAGEQPGLRYYDEADRNRTRASVLLSANPVNMASIYFQYAHGKDEYLADDFIPEGREQFGLLDSDYDAWNVGATVNPNEKVAFGINYGQDKWSAFQKSRNANPPPDSSWTDPNRNWTLDNGEDVNNFNVWLELTRAIENLDLRFDYDRSDSDNEFAYGGPRIATLAATPPGQFIPLPNVTNDWTRFTADAKFYFTPRIGVGVGYYYEDFSVEDFATIDSNGSIYLGLTGDPRWDYLGEVMTAYANRDYSGHNFFIRGLYRF
jgi:MtrB/PioB family decaheme-associated outer membrane protein